jgi:hypothetical protein
MPVICQLTGGLGQQTEASPGTGHPAAKLPILLAWRSLQPDNNKNDPKGEVMNRSATALSLLLLAGAVHAAPTVYPTGTTIYDPQRTWNGYTILITNKNDGAVLIDMNGRTVNQWTSYSGSAGGPARILPCGTVVAGEGEQGGGV